MKIKTIDINALEWFDKVNGNSYFSAIVTLNYGMKNAKVLKLPFEYGYGDHYIDMSNQLLIKEGYREGKRQFLEIPFGVCFKDEIIAYFN